MEVAPPEPELEIAVEDFLRWLNRYGVVPPERNARVVIELNKVLKAAAHRVVSVSPYRLAASIN